MAGGIQVPVIVSANREAVNQDNRTFCARRADVWRAGERDLSARASSGMARMLSRYIWHEFATLTYRGNPPPDEAIERHFRAWVWKRLEVASESVGLSHRDGDRLRGPLPNAWKRGRHCPIWVMAVESGGRYGRRHVHSIIKWPDAIKRAWPRYENAGRLWKSNAGVSRGYVKCEFPRSQRHVISYCAKYLSKPWSELSISPSFEACADFESGRSTGVVCGVGTSDPRAMDGIGGG